MANFEYKNIDEILETNEPIRGIRVTLEDNKLLEKIPVIPAVEPPPSPTDPFEFHTFLPNGAYVSSLHEIETWKIDGTSLSMDIHRDMRATRNLPGVYKIVYNFLKNWIGGYSDSTKLFISDISTDRTELKLSLINPDSVNATEQLKQFVLSYLKPTPSFPTIVLNFGQNKIVSVINVTPNVNFDGTINSIFVKLYEPLSADLDIYFECWIAEELMRPYIDTVHYIAENVIIQPNRLRGPNLEVDIDYWTVSETDYKSWNDILSTNVQTSQEILDRYISSSNLPVQLNVDFREFKNFVFYSSAEDRVNNFVYKIELIERYNNELNILNSYTGSISANKIKITSLRDKTISGFDSFERWLYYETTASNWYTNQVTASIVPYPKYEVTGSEYNIATKEGKYKFYTSGSSDADEWYYDVISKARDYDLKNYNALNKAIPEYLREDTDNNQFTTFVNMVGHHFDVIYLYTDHILKKNLRVEHPKDGMSQDLIYEVTKNFGWTLSHGTQAKDLWEYALGVSGSGEPIWTGKVTTNKYLAKSEQERTKEVWRRILNNLPYIYKSKGTSRGIKALLGAYGIPQTLLTIREYGGPDNADLGIIPRAEWEKHTYYLNFSGSYPLPTHNQYVSVPWERVSNINDEWQYPDTLTFRWKMEPNKLYQYSNDPVQTLLQKNSGSRIDWFVTMNKNGTDVEKGSIYFYIGDGTNYATASITDEYFYDDVPLNLMLRRSLSNDSTSSIQTYDFIVKTAKYGKIAVERSASIVVSGSLTGSYNRAWASDGTLFIGSGSNTQTDKILSGSIFELRYWVNPLNQSSFDNHVLAARAYNGNTDTSSFYDLQAQWKFWQKFDVAVTTSLSSFHPDQKKKSFYSSSKSAYFYGFNSGAFESIVETYNMEVATLASNTIYTEKVRIDSGSLIAGLSPDRSSEVSAFDTYSVDSNKLMVAFSPQSVINEDIYEALGGVEIDDYIGDYSNISQQEYPNLKWLAREYWQKYPNKNDFNSYIDLISAFDFSVFDQIRQTLPARANPILGLVLEQNILERSKVGNIGKNLSAESQNVFDSTELFLTADTKVDYISNSTSIQMIGFDSADGDIDDISGDYDVKTDIIDVSKETSKLGLITGSNVDTTVNYYGNTTTINTPEEIFSVKYNDSIAVLKDEKIQIETRYDQENAEIQIEKNNVDIEYKNSKTTVNVNTPDVFINENVNTKTTVNVNTPDVLINENVNTKTTVKITEQDLTLKYENQKTKLENDLISDVFVEYLKNDAKLNNNDYKTKADYTNNKTSINDLSQKEFSSKISTINLGSDTYIKIYDYNIGGMHTSEQYANLKIQPSSSYNKTNIYKTNNTTNYGYGAGWTTITNDPSKKFMIMINIDSYRKDNFYNSFYLYYSSSADILSRNFYSSSFTASKTSNQENLSLGIQNHRFLGSRLIGPDINVNTTNTPDGKPVIEVNVVGSGQIIYNTYIGGSNTGNLKVTGI